MVINRTPWVFHDLVQELDRMSRSVDSAFTNISGCSNEERAGMILDEDEAHLSLELPGVQPSDLEVVLERNQLRIEAKREDLQDDDEEAFLRERRFGTYSRTYDLPWPVIEEQIEAEFQAGILNLRLRRAPDAAPRKINVKSQKS